MPTSRYLATILRPEKVNCLERLCWIKLNIIFPLQCKQPGCEMLAGEKLKARQDKMKQKPVSFFVSFFIWHASTACPKLNSSSHGLISSLIPHLLISRWDKMQETDTVVKREENAWAVRQGCVVSQKLIDECYDITSCCGNSSTQTGLICLAGWVLVRQGVACCSHRLPEATVAASVGQISAAVLTCTLISTGQSHLHFFILWHESTFQWKSLSVDIRIIVFSFSSESSF